MNLKRPSHTHLDTTLILAAYGSSRGSHISSRIREWAFDIQDRVPYSEVLTTFHKEPPFFADVLCDATSREFVIVPLFTSAGYIATTVLPNEINLAGARSAQNGHRVYYAPALGEHPRMPQLTCRVIARALKTHRLDPDEVAVALVGHGTTRHAHSGDTTEHNAAAVRKTLPVAEGVAVFLNQPPEIGEIFKMTSSPIVVVVPFLLARSMHTILDIPQRLSIPVEPGIYPPPPCQSLGRRIICTTSPFDEPDIIDMIIELAQQAKEQN